MNYNSTNTYAFYPFILGLQGIHVMKMKLMEDKGSDTNGGDDEI